MRFQVRTNSTRFGTAGQPLVIPLFRLSERVRLETDLRRFRLRLTSNAVSKFFIQDTSSIGCMRTGKTTTPRQLKLNFARPYVCFYLRIWLSFSIAALLGFDDICDLSHDVSLRVSAIWLCCDFFDLFTLPCFCRLTCSWCFSRDGFSSDAPSSSCYLCMLTHSEACRCLSTKRRCDTPARLHHRLRVRLSLRVRLPSPLP